VDKHGLPVFLKTVFPGSAGEIDGPGKVPDAKSKDNETREKN
jgi:hypothetical protein